jgi:hypothetical protein
MHIRPLTALFLGLFGSDRVDLDASQEVLSGVGVTDVLDAEVDTLLDVPVSNNLLDEYTDCAGSDVVNDTRSALISHINYTR